MCKICICPFVFIALPIYAETKRMIAADQMNIRSIAISYYLYFLTVSIAAQPTMKIERFMQEDGLSHRWIRQIIQDKDGFIWLATADGLNRYDGFEFKRYEVRGEGFDISNIRSMQINSDGRIWIHPYNKDSTVLFQPHTGASSTVKKGIDFFTPDDQQDHIITSPFYAFIPKMDTLRERYTWPLDRNKIEFPNIKFLGRGAKTYGMESIVTQNRDQELWVWHNMDTVKSSIKLFPFHYARADLTSFEWEYFQLEKYLDIQLANANLPIDTKGRFWFPAFDKGASGVFDFFQLPDSLPLKNWEGMRVDNRYNIWIYDKEVQLFRFDIRRRELKRIGQMDNVRIEVFEDREGIIWIGTENGLLKIRQKKQWFDTYLDQPFELGTPLPIGNTMSYILEGPNGQVYSNRGYRDIFQIDPKAKQSKALGLGSVSFLYAITSNHLFMSRKNALIEQLDLASGEIITFDKPAEPKPFSGNLTHKIALEHPERFGLFLLDTLTKEVQWLKEFSNEQMRTVFWQEDLQWFWANNKNGILKIDLNDLSSQYFEILPTVNDRHIRGWLPDGDGMWLATLDGLKRLDVHTGEVNQHFTTKDGLPHNRIYSLVGEGKNLWLGTHNGLCYFNTVTLDVRNFYVEDGLTHNEFNTHSALLASDGKIWMGGLNGINVFDPIELLQIEQDSAALLLTKYKEYNKAGDMTLVQDNVLILENQSFIISSDIQSFSFQFILNSLVQPSKNQYYWYLEGYEPAWANVNEEPIANYQNVTPGNFILKIKATDHRGNAAQNELAIPVRILEVWYLRWWAWLLYTLAFGSAVYIFYRFQINRKMAEQEALRLKELDVVKNKLYTNITHEFRTPLTVILGMVRRLKNGTKESRGQAGEMIKRNGQHLLDLVNQMLELAKLESNEMSLNLVEGDIAVFLKYLLESFSSLADTKNIELHFNAENKSISMAYDPDKFQKIIANLLSNAIKFTPENGEVNVSLSEKENEVLIKIKDTGRGIPPEQLPHIFDRFYQADGSHTREGEGTGIGLALVKELAKLMDGEITVDSEVGIGTECTLWFPKVLKAAINTTLKKHEIEKVILQPSFLTPLESSPLPSSNGETVQRAVGHRRQL